jgi:hypothetical protein
MPDVADLRIFRWDVLANGEDMQLDLDALAAQLRMADRRKLHPMKAVEP